MQDNVLNAQMCAAYYGAKVNVSANEYTKAGSGYYAVPIPIDDDTLEVALDGGGTTYSVPIESCKLILTPLADISDEDAIEACKLINDNANKREGTHTPFQVVRENNRTDVWFGYNCIHFYHDGSILDDTQKSWVNSSVVDYQRSKGYDLGHCSISSLIESGYAIAKNK